MYIVLPLFRPQHLSNFAAQCPYSALPFALAHLVSLVYHDKGNFALCIETCVSMTFRENAGVRIHCFSQRTSLVTLLKTPITLCVTLCGAHTNYTDSVTLQRQLHRLGQVID